MTYESNIRKEVSNFVARLVEEFRGQFDYIEGIDGELPYPTAFGATGPSLR